MSAAWNPWRQFLRLYQMYLDKTVPHVRLRWLVATVIAFSFSLRVFHLRGFYFVSFCLGLYVSSILLWFMAPFINEDFGPPCLPVTTGSDEFRPFIGGFTEFQLWYTMTKAYTISTTLTFFSIFDVPAHPHLVAFGILSVLGAMFMSIGHMIKYRYVPFTTGKMVYSRKN